MHAALLITLLGSSALPLPLSPYPAPTLTKTNHDINPDPERKSISAPARTLSCAVPHAAPQEQDLKTLLPEHTWWGSPLHGGGGLRGFGGHMKPSVK